MLPNFLHIGQGKSGSTALHFMLQQNPDICLVESKEAHFFDTDAFAGGLDSYARYFAHHAGQPVVGDITPAYGLPHALERIAASLPDVKIAVCFRHPVARAWSHYFHDIRLLEKPGAFLDSLKPDSEYVQGGMGGRTLQMLYSLFPRDRILTLIYERDFREITAAYQRVCAFLGIEAHPIDPTLTAGRGFIPAITFPKLWGTVQDYRGVHKYGPRDVVVETRRDTEVYEVAVLEGQRAAYRSIFDNVTWSLGPDGIAEAWSSFHDDAALLRSLLGDELPEWNDLRALKAPPALRSRLGIKETIRNYRERRGDRPL